MRCQKNGVRVVDHGYADEPSLDGPLTMWGADKWICHGCSKEIIIGFSKGYQTEGEKDFAKNLAFAEMEGIVHHTKYVKDLRF